MIVSRRQCFKKVFGCRANPKLSFGAGQSAHLARNGQDMDDGSGKPATGSPLLSVESI
jgi:hypothetical protein